MRTGKTILTALFVSLGLAAAGVANAGPDTIAAAAAAPAQLIDVAQFKALMARERGHVIILSIWATWCAPCRKEMPDLLRVEQQLAGRQVRLIGLSMDEPGQLQSLVEPFRLRFFPTLRSYLRNTPDMDSLISVIDPAWNEILPTTYLLDRNGRVALRLQGTKPYAEMRDLVLAVTKKPQ